MHVLHIPLYAHCLDAISHPSQGDCAKAKLGFEEALRIRVKLLGRKHSDVAGTLSSLGLVLSHQVNFMMTSYLRGNVPLCYLS